MDLKKNLTIAYSLDRSASCRIEISCALASHNLSTLLKSISLFFSYIFLF